MKLTMNTIRDCFNIILSGNKKESHLAARQVRKLLYNSGSNSRSRFKDIENQINRAPADYADITEEWRQENFIMAISVIYFLRSKEKEFDFFFPWFFKLLLHSNGNIRYAAVRMITTDLGPLTVYIRVSNFKSTEIKGLSKERSDEILFFLFIGLNYLLAKTWKPAYEKYDYVDSLPTSPYKSVQMVMARMYEFCGDRYMEKLVQKYKQNLR